MRISDWSSDVCSSDLLHLDTNLRAPLVLIQRFAAALPVGARGLVVNILDTRVWNLAPGYLSYTLSKAGLWTLTRMLAPALAPAIRVNAIGPGPRSEEHTSELQSLMRNSYAVFCLNKKKKTNTQTN